MFDNVIDFNNLAYTIKSLNYLETLPLKEIINAYSIFIGDKTLLTKEVEYLGHKGLIQDIFPYTGLTITDFLTSDFLNKYGFVNILQYTEYSKYKSHTFYMLKDDNMYLTNVVYFLYDGEVKASDIHGNVFSAKALHGLNPSSHPHTFS